MRERVCKYDTIHFKISFPVLCLCYSLKLFSVLYLCYEILEHHVPGFLLNTNNAFITALKLKSQMDQHYVLLIKWPKSDSFIVHYIIIDILIIYIIYYLYVNGRNNEYFYRGWNGFISGKNNHLHHWYVHIYNWWKSLKTYIYL